MSSEQEKTSPAVTQYWEERRHLRQRMEPYLNAAACRAEGKVSDMIGEYLNKILDDLPVRSWDLDLFKEAILVAVIRQLSERISGRHDIRANLSNAEILDTVFRLVEADHSPPQR